MKGYVCAVVVLVLGTVATTTGYAAPSAASTSAGRPSAPSKPGGQTTPGPTAKTALPTAPGKPTPGRPEPGSGKGSSAINGTGIRR